MPESQKARRGFIFWFPMALLLFMLLAPVGMPGQLITLFDYDWGQSVGLLEPATPTLKYINRSIAFADFVQIVLLILGIVGLFKRKFYGIMAAVGESVILVYITLLHGYQFWTVDPSYGLDFSTGFKIFATVILSLFAIAGLYSAYLLMANRAKLVDDLVPESVV